MRVGMLVTGRAEANGIGHALTRLFPGHEFPCIFERINDRQPYSSFTSSRLPVPASKARPDVEKIVQAAAAHLVPGRNGDPPDFLIVLDDLELDNVSQPQVVADTFTSAVRSHLVTLNKINSKLVKKCEAAFLERMSLHLVNPMIESWFFADPGALAAARAPTDAAMVSATRDPEDFLTTDAMYRDDSEESCPCWVDDGKSKKLRPKWLGTQPRERHPKGYLQWLCRDGTARNCTTYNETNDGGRALSGIDWTLLLNRPNGEVQYLRSLVADLEDALQQQPVMGPVSQTQAPVTSRGTPRSSRLLRNL